MQLRFNTVFSHFSNSNSSIGVKMICEHLYHFRSAVYNEQDSRIKVKKFFSNELNPKTRFKTKYRLQWQCNSVNLHSWINFGFPVMLPSFLLNHFMAYVVCIMYYLIQPLDYNFTDSKLFLICQKRSRLHNIWKNENEVNIHAPELQLTWSLLHWCADLTLAQIMRLTSKKQNTRI